MKLLITFAVFAAVFQLGAFEDLYTVTNTSGPAFWGVNDPLCNGQAQTPINLDTDSVKCEKTRLRIRYLYTQIESVKIVNDGHGFYFVFNFVKKTPRILQWFDERRNLNEYVFHSAHIHWGPQSTGGSEHTVNGQRYAAEMHLVHYNSKYANLSAAIAQSDGLAVLGVFFELAKSPKANAKNENQFVKYLSKIPNEGDEFVIDSEKDYKNILDLIKFDVKDFISYKGSLTTPGCFESVRWLVSTEPIKITTSELRALTDFYPTNYRPIQALNGRTVIGSCF